MNHINWVAPDALNHPTTTPQQWNRALAAACSIRPPKTNSPLIHQGWLQALQDIHHVINRELDLP